MSEYSDQLLAYTRGERARVGDGHKNNPYHRENELFEFYEDGYEGDIFDPTVERE